LPLELLRGLTEYSEDLIEHFSERLMRGSGYSAAGFAGGYDLHRPSPPPALLEALCLEAQVDKPKLVVDLGSGTGLSTRAWAERADEVVGVEASAEMREQAEVASASPNLRYVQAFAQQTGLPDRSADIVTCSQSFHWMEPQSVLAEVARILRPGGVFAAYDYDWPPVVHPEVEAAFETMIGRIGRMRAERGQPRYSKEGHLDRIRASGHFRYTREIVLHSRDRGTAGRIVGMALSLGPLTVMLQEGVSEEEVGLAALREVAAKALGDREVDIFISYRARIGVK
jgi:SAM-dependent methyltransferase